MGVELVLVGRVGRAEPPVSRRRSGPLGVRDGRQPAAGSCGRHAQGVPEQAQALGIRGEPKAALQTGRVPVGLEDGQSQSVKRLDRDLPPCVGQQASQALAQLIGRPTGRSGPDTRPADGVVGDEMDQPVGQGSGFPEPGQPQSAAGHA